MPSSSSWGLPAEYLRNFIRGIARSKVVENVRKIFGGYESVIRNLRENLKKLGFKLGDFPVIGQGWRCAAREGRWW